MFDDFLRQHEVVFGLVVQSVGIGCTRDRMGLIDFDLVLADEAPHRVVVTPTVGVLTIGQMAEAGECQRLNDRVIPEKPGILFIERILKTIIISYFLLSAISFGFQIKPKGCHINQG